MNKQEKVLSRREMIQRGASVGVGIIAAPMLNLDRFRIFANSAKEYSARAIDLVWKSSIIGTAMIKLVINSDSEMLIAKFNICMFLVENDY